jgi:hypothetical protein
MRCPVCGQEVDFVDIAGMKACPRCGEVLHESDLAMLGLDLNKEAPKQGPKLAAQLKLPFPTREETTQYISADLGEPYSSSDSYHIPEEVRNWTRRNEPL